MRSGSCGIACAGFTADAWNGTILIPWQFFRALSGKLSSAAGLVILYAVTQVTRQLIQPKMVGDSIGMDAMTTLIFLFIGYRSAGLNWNDCRNSIRVDPDSVV